MKIGILIIATGKYTKFIPPLYKSIKKHFFKKEDVNLFVFTDGNIPENEKIIKIYQEHLGWPHATLKRFEIFNKHKEILSKMDYLFYCDADMLFVSDVNKEILPEKDSNGLVGVIHPGFYNKNKSLYTYERNEKSLAYISFNEGEMYYAGGFNGGTSESFLKMSKNLSNNIQKDLENNIIAVWHDESHLNRYFIDNIPKKLSPSYCYPESWNLPFDKKLLALDKNHTEIRK